MRERERERWGKITLSFNDDNSGLKKTERARSPLSMEKLFFHYRRKHTPIPDFLTSTPWAAAFACEVSTAVAAVRRNLCVEEEFGKREFVGRTSIAERRRRRRRRLVKQKLLSPRFSRISVHEFVHSRSSPRRSSQRQRQRREHRAAPESGRRSSRSCDASRRHRNSSAWHQRRRIPSAEARLHHGSEQQRRDCLPVASARARARERENASGKTTTLVRNTFSFEEKRI